MRQVTVQNSEELSWWDDNNCHAKCYLYDPTQANARSYVASQSASHLLYACGPALKKLNCVRLRQRYIWSKLKSGYYDHGIKIFWLDASEPGLL